MSCDQTKQLSLSSPITIKIIIWRLASRGSLISLQRSIHFLFDAIMQLLDCTTFKVRLLTLSLMGSFLRALSPCGLAMGMQMSNGTWGRKFPPIFIFRCTLWVLLQFPSVLSVSLPFHFQLHASHTTTCTHSQRSSRAHTTKPVSARSATPFGVRASQCGNLPNNRVPRASRHVIKFIFCELYAIVRGCGKSFVISHQGFMSCRKMPCAFIYQKTLIFSMYARSEMKTNGNLFLSICSQCVLVTRCEFFVCAIFALVHVYDLKKGNVTWLFS